MVVTRFAPSPTGYLHIGGARTALFNWLFARSKGGKFLLRIEDTDTKRNTPTATQQVINDLKWLGIEWDEGPGTKGEKGPYYQSQRRDIYDKYLKQLLEEKKAYYCFDTPTELQTMRDKATNKKENFLYPRPEVFPTVEDMQKAKKDGKAITVRFAVNRNQAIVVKDEIRGEVVFASEQTDDFIIQKSDGFPTYHFACVVDDELMGVTHIIRGQEHLMNTPGHQALQDALGFRRPVYAHMSVTISENGGKLSKRERPQTLAQAIKVRRDTNLEELAEAGKISIEELNSFLAGKTVPDVPAIEAMAKFIDIRLPEINVVDFFKSGYLPETMVNFLALLGWGSQDKKEIMTVQELQKNFDISRLTKSNSLFDRKKLAAFNTEHIRMLAKEKLIKHFRDYLQVVNSPVHDTDDEKLGLLLQINAGARTLEDVDLKSRFLFFENDKIEYDAKAVNKVLLQADALETLKIVRDKLGDMKEFTEDGIENMLRALAEERQVGLGKVAQPLRVAICGTTISPPIFDSVKLLGKKNAMARIDIALEKFSLEGN